jgi:hypothetical protein
MEKPIHTITHIDISELWTPRRDVLPIAPLVFNDQIKKLEVATAPAPVTIDGGGGFPNNLFDLSASESPIKVQGRTMSQVSISFSRNPSDENFGGVRVWFTGYKGSTEPLLVAEGSGAPVVFLAETTGETVSVTVQAVSTSGVPIPFELCPSTTVLLDGVISAPPAPNVSQTLVAIELGFQFAFDQLNLGATQDVIDAYRVYRNTSNTSVGASLLRTLPHDPTATGAIVVQDSTGGGQVYYYFVSAVNTAGIESSKTAAQAGATTSSNVGTGSQVPVNTTGAFTGGNPLTQSGTTTTINVGAFTMQWGFGTVSYSSGSINPGAYGTYYVYADDPHYQGGAATYVTSLTPLTVYQSENRIYIGTITTVAGGGGTGGGGGGGCALSGAPVRLYGRPEWWTKRVLPCEDFITIETEAGRRGTFSRNDRRYCQRGLLPLNEWKVGDLALTEDGEERVTAVLEQKLRGATIDSYEGEFGHVYSAWGFIGHNNKPAVP